ncbi:MAG: HDOD domain-containing protein [Phycisphaeraceae bacterium]|nr:HDOD domain-containing protein [Phycisphaeraceae bacterium]
MNQQLLEQVLTCPTLPTLPAVAVRVLQLTADSDVSLDDVAEVIEKDQGLSAKVLRTVNSPLYGLRQRCGSIPRAMVLMGLGPVKSLAIGFSLVSTVNDDSDPRFDYVSYWRRGLVTAASARILANDLGIKEADEAFLGGLLQDVGMIALYRALGADYLRVLDAAGGDHRQLVKHELASLDTQHPDIGATLAQRWRLPDELVLPIKYHERPTAAPIGCCRLIRCVALGNLFHDTLTDADPVPALRRLYQRAKEWFRLDSTCVDELMPRVAETATELSRLLDLDAGVMPEAEAIVREAGDRLLRLASGDCTDEVGWAKSASALIETGTEFDPLTGTLSKGAFDHALRQTYARAVARQEPLSLLLVRIGGSERSTLGLTPEATDEAILNTTSALRHEFSHIGGTIARLGIADFAVLLPGLPRLAALRGAQSLASSLSNGSGEARNFTVSVGVVSMDSNATHSVGSPEQLLHEVAKAVDQAGVQGQVCAVTARAA